MSMTSITTAVVAFLMGAVPMVALGVGAHRRAWTTPSSYVGAAVWGVLLLAWCAGIAVGTVGCPNPGLPLLEAILLGCAAGLGLAAPGVRARCRKGAEFLRVCAVVLAIFVSLFVLEWPYNQLLFSMEAPIARLNGMLVGAGLLACWFVGQRRSGVLIAYVAVCLGCGLANYFVCQFKEQTILPADLLAIGTAAQVSAGYNYVLLNSAVLAICAFTAFAAVALLVPSPRLTRMRVAANLVLGCAMAALLVNWYNTHDIEKDYGVKVDVWSTRESYETFGTVPSFLQRMQEVKPRVPEGYTTEKAAELQAALAAAWDEEHPGYPRTLEEARAYQERTTGSAELPSVVAVMNESFSDLSIYPEVEGYDGLPLPGGVEAAVVLPAGDEPMGDSGVAVGFVDHGGPLLFDALGVQESGEVYTSVRGGGTCNSEFEYLTGATLGSMGGGVYPYMFYDLDEVESLPAYFSALGYATSAIHPAEASNWRRDVVYRQLGFDRFLSEDAMPTGADTLRDLITDRVTYDAILDLLDDDEDTPQFIFDVTLQNHGGYDTGLLDSYPHDGVTVGGEVIEGMSEYLSCIDASVDDLAYLLERLAALDRKVIVVFFGDHQPGFNDQMAEAAYGVEVGDLTLDQVQQRFETPYFIWANYEMDAEDLEGGALSLGYLMAQTAYAAGLPLTDFQKALLQLHGEMPAVNLNGYSDADGTWYWIGQDGPVRDAYDAYAVLQYADLFDEDGNGAFDAFVEDHTAV